MLLKRAQDAGEVRPDTTFMDVGRLVGNEILCRTQAGQYVTVTPEEVPSLVDELPLFALLAAVAHHA